MGPRRSAAALPIAIVLLGYLIGGGAQLSLALLTDSENDPSTFTTAASFPDTTATDRRQQRHLEDDPLPARIRPPGRHLLRVRQRDRCRAAAWRPSGPT